MNTLLTKTHVMSLRQCPRKLWLELNRPDLAPEADPGQKRQTLYGNLVGAAARARLDKPRWVRRATREENVTLVTLLELKTDADAFVEVPVVEPTQRLYCRADALLRKPQGFVLEETKASTVKRKSDGRLCTPQAQYIEDAAVQLWAFENAGVPVCAAHLNLLNQDLRLQRQRTIDQLGEWVADAFVQVDITDEARQLQPQVIQWIRQAREVADSPTMPMVDPGPHCKNPNPCPFVSHCARLLGDRKHQPPLTLLPDVSGKALAKRLSARGYHSLTDVPAQELTETANPSRAALHLRIQQAHASGMEVFDTRAAAAIEAIPYPRRYFDFEGIDLALPVWTEVGPYEQVPFQWSCHTQDAPGAQLRHDEFLDTSGADPSWACLRAMIGVLGDGASGSIIVYHATYEKGRMQYLAERFPAYRDLIERWIAQLVDLLPVVKDCYYHPNMAGSFSIKPTLAALAPELTYADLQGVKNGSEAQWAYIQVALLHDQTEDPVRIIEGMRRYCERDSLGMYVLAERLLAKRRHALPTA